MSRHQKANVWSTITDKQGNPIQVSPARLEFEALEFARTEPLPDPATLTIGQMIELVTLVVRLRDMIAHPVFSLQSLRRADVLENSPGFSEFMGWVERKADPTNLIESAHKLRDGLSKRFNKRHSYIEALPLSRSVELLEFSPANPKIRHALSLADSLNETDWTNLRALEALGATSRLRYTTRERVAEKAKNGDHDSKHNRQSFNRLQQHNLIESKRRIGTWLTAKGVALLGAKKRQ